MTGPEPTELLAWAYIRETLLSLPPGLRRLSHGLWGGGVGTAPRGLRVGRAWGAVALAAAGLATRRGHWARGSHLCVCQALGPLASGRSGIWAGGFLRSGCRQVRRPARPRSSMDGLDLAQPVACLRSRGGRGPSVACRETSGPATAGEKPQASFLWSRGAPAPLPPCAGPSLPGCGGSCTHAS